MDQHGNGEFHRDAIAVAGNNTTTSSGGGDDETDAAGNGTSSTSGGTSGDEESAAMSMGVSMIGVLFLVVSLTVPHEI